MKEKIVQKFCRDCYTTTPHRVIEVNDLKNGGSYKKTLCTMCLRAKAYKKSVPKKTVMHEDLLEI
ncbi:MAG: hypothetical protein V3R82_00735 [Candidatus Hydrothermarchaeales archaeon]